MHSDVLDSRQTLIRLFKHECDRVFCDRLINDDDRVTYLKEIKDILTTPFTDSVDKAMVEPNLFGDFEHSVERIQSGGTFEDPRLYKDMSSVGGYEWVRTIFGNVLEQYNIERSQMSLVLFEQALEHIARIHRIIRCPRGNALLVGVGGSGKQSLTNLAAYCAGYKLFQITLSRGYGEEQFKEELKELYKLLGQGEVVFLFTDAHVVEEGFLEFINNMLTTGIVPALYAQDERDALCNTVRAEVRKLGKPETPDNLWTYYVNKCRNNLHIVLAMSPSGSKLRLRCRNFPGLVSNTVIDWFFPWPNDALEKVAEYFLQGEPLISSDHRNSVVSHFVFAHQNVSEAAQRFEDELRRKYFVTPKNYLDFIQNYKTQLKDNNASIQSSVKRLAGGLTKLIEAAEKVDVMRVELSEKKIIVDAKYIEVKELIEEITAKTKNAEEQKKIAKIEQEAAVIKAEEIRVGNLQAEDELAVAMPLIAEAEAALNTIEPKDIDELKRYATPSKALMLLLTMIIAFRPTNEKLTDTWGDAKRLLNNSDFISKLRTYAKDDIKESIARKVKNTLEKNPDDLTEEKMTATSKACLGLFKWVVAMVK
jgi:dynein heavy chain